jgi:hypothetical protein
MTQVVAEKAGESASSGPTVASEHRTAYLERLEASAREGPREVELRLGLPDGATDRESWPAALDDARLELLVKQIRRLLRARSLKPGFSALHVGCGDGRLLAELSRRFPDAEWNGVDWPTTASASHSSGVRIYRIDVDELFRSPVEDRQERFNLVVLSGGFDSPGGARSALAPEWVDGWLGKYASYTIGVATRPRLRELRERGWALALESRRDDGQLVCWTEKSPLRRGRRRWPVGLDRYLSFPGWFWQNARRHGLGDAIYFAGHVAWAILRGGLPVAALSDRDLRSRFCARLRRTRRIRPNTVYAFVFLGEFGYEVLNWQGVVRKFARKLPPSSSIVVGGRRGLQPFYENAAQYVEIDGVPEYRDSYAAAYFAMAPEESRRSRPPTRKQFEYDRRVRRAVEAHVRRQLANHGRRVEFVFSSQANVFEDCVFGVDPRFYGVRGYHGSIYGSLSLENDHYAAIAADADIRADVEAKLGFSLDEPYVFVQSRRRVIGPRSGGDLDARSLVQELARHCRVVYLSFSSARHLDSGSAGAFEGITHYEAASFREQSCLIAHAHRCVLLTEGDLGSHTYLPPLLGKDAVVVASEDVFARRSAPVDFWNRNVFRFGGQMIPLPAERLDSPAAVSAAAEEILRGRTGGDASGESAPPPTKRILFIMRHAGYARNCEHVINQLAEEGHAIHIAVGIPSKKSHDAEVLPRLSARWPSLTHGRLPKVSVRRWDKVTALSRLVIDYLRYFDPAYEYAPRLRARATRRLPQSVVSLFERVAFLRRRGVLAFLHACLHGLDRAAPSHIEREEFLAILKPDLVVFTPLLDHDSDSLDYLKTARKLGIPTALCVASWDNLSNKGLVQLVPDRVILWNQVQQQEAVRMHAIPAERITITGAHLFDHWFEMRPSCTREEFCRARGLDPRMPFLLYVCSSSFVAEDEVPFVKRWIEAVRASDSALADWGMVVRPHPGNRKQWEVADLPKYADVVVWPPLGEGPVDYQGKQNYFDSLYHAAGIVGINTSALIEGGIIGTPVFTILEEEFRETQIGTIHFHYLVKGGLLTTAEGLDEHVLQLRRVLVDGDPERDKARDAFIRDFIRPNGLDTPSSPLAVAALHSLMSENGSPY